MKAIRPTVLAALLAIAALPTPAGTGQARANHLAGPFVRCAQVIEFVAPEAGAPGLLLLLGIEPGFPQYAADPDLHQFQLAPNLPIDPALRIALTDLAASDRYTCLQMVGDTDPVDPEATVTSLTIAPSTRICGPISQRFDGVFHFLVVTVWYGDLIGDADELIRSDPYLPGLLGTLGRYQDESTCLTLDTDVGGRLVALSVDARIAHCGLVTDREDLEVGELRLGDPDSSSTDLLPARTRAATALLVDTGIPVCVEAVVSRSEWQTAELSFSMRRCGDITRSSTGAIQVDELPIPSILLTDRQAEKLAAALEGDGCIEVDVVANVTTVALSDLRTPDPTDTPRPTEPVVPSTEPSPTLPPVIESRPPSPQVSAPPTPTASPMAVVPAGTVTDGDPLVPVLLIVLGVLVAASAGSFVMYRRQRREPSTAMEPAVAPDLLDAATTAQESEPVPAVPEIALTPREQEVLSMLLDGLSNKEIANRLFISESTAGVHVSNLMGKLGAHSRGEAAAIAYRSGLRVPNRFQH